MDLRPYIEKFARRQTEIETALSDPKLFDNPAKAQELSREYARLKDLNAAGAYYAAHDHSLEGYPPATK